MGVRALLVSALMLGAASGQPGQSAPTARNTWGNNICQVNPKPYPAVGIQPFRGGAENCQGGGSYQFGMYFPTGRQILMNAYPILTVFATGVPTTISASNGRFDISFVEARNYLHGLLKRHIKYYIYAQCRCTVSMTPQMAQLQKCFMFKDCDTNNAAGKDKGLIADFQAFLLNVNNANATANIQQYLLGLMQYTGGAPILDNLRCQRTSSSRNNRLQEATSYCDISIRKSGFAEGATLSSKVTCYDENRLKTCPKIGFLV